MKAVVIFSFVCLPLRSLTVISPFGYRIHPLSGKITYHPGVDLRARYDFVYAIFDGIVDRVSYDPSLGLAIQIRRGKVVAIYGHLSKSLVLPDDTVRAGQVIAISGASGRVTAAHLHFAIRYGGRYLNPLNFLYELLKTTHHE
ncbi:M23 family metallopeptidase [Mucilaginibacter sp. 21P]|uniref:M23 family metallopeptidase n=1 Tax=Mucilaginibacter sp. 21P TaxID=2778902 RepID=UPI001C5963DD|nr:M23 family metallopeptidase [Mucilaginibacter sp. 21P]QXV63675.1 M23 family metallopeptidase [Mucilaginibacter sp. 21P]